MNDLGLPVAFGKPEPQAGPSTLPTLDPPRGAPAVRGPRGAVGAGKRSRGARGHPSSTWGNEARPDVSEPDRGWNNGVKVGACSFLAPAWPGSLGIEAWLMVSEGACDGSRERGWISSRRRERSRRCRLEPPASAARAPRDWEPRWRRWRMASSRRRPTRRGFSPASICRAWARWRTGRRAAPWVKWAWGGLERGRSWCRGWGGLV